MKILFRQIRYRLAILLVRDDYVVVPTKAFDNLCAESKELFDLKYPEVKSSERL